MSIIRLKYLFNQFINKTATPEEIQEFLSMIEKEDHNNQVQILLDELWESCDTYTPLSEERSERIFNQLMEASSVNEAERSYRIAPIWLQAAAMLIIGLSAFFYSRLPEKSQTYQVKVDNVKTVKPDKPGRRFINLPDGSSVILNENSRLDLAADFGDGGRREVYLQGEAYFDITHDSKHPFIVHTGKLQTTVMGTAFNIKASPGDKTVTVTVTRGKVKVGDNKNTYNVIVPNEQVIFDRDVSTYVKKPVKAETFVKWTSEDIYFDDVSMKDVANQLQERFNVSILFSNDQMKACKFSATFLKDQNLEQILNVIGEFNQIKYHFQGAKTVMLDGAGCKL
jgi:transmembrane sensor